MFKKPTSGRKSNLSQLGLLDVPNLDDEEPMDLSDDDIDLEAELAALNGNDSKKHRQRKPMVVPQSNLEAMIAQSLQDVPSDDDASGDDDDPELLNELKDLGLDDEETPPSPCETEVPSPREAEVPPIAPRTSRPAPPPPGSSLSTESSTMSLLQDRITNYIQAEKSAKESGETSRARRFARGLKTLQDLLKQAKAGRSIDESEIPPPVLISKASPDPAVPATQDPPAVPPRAQRVAPPIPESPKADKPEDPQPSDGPSLPEPSHAPPPLLKKEAASNEGLEIILKRQKEFKVAALSAKHAGDKPLALEYLKVVKQFDIVVEAFKKGEEMDLNELPTPEVIAAMFKSQKVEDETVQKSTEPTPVPEPPQNDVLITASTVEEALRQRLIAFQQMEAKAKEENNSSKARRIGRIVKQYKDAIQLHSAGKPLDLDELPPPPNHAPFPTQGNASSAGAASPATPNPAPRPSPRPSPRPIVIQNDKQIALLLQRQKEFKEAALMAKKNGDLDKAREYLRASKGFDSMLEAARGGLLVDLKSIPLPPKVKDKLEQTFDIVTASDCTPADVPSISLDDDDAISKLHEQLTNQLKLCLTNRDHYRAMGNVAEMNRFEHLAVKVKQDLDVVVVAKSLNQALPKFHYESKQFAIVQCNTDLNENDLELTIVRGISYNVTNPKDVDTYVKFEYPYPPEAPSTDRSALVKDTNNPEYNAIFPLPIHRASRQCLRIFKRYGIKFEVYSRGGWFSRDTLLGTCNLKLAPLQTQVTMHEALPLMDGRKRVGGSLEVKIRIRTPILQQQIENTTHRWLVIDN